MASATAGVVMEVGQQGGAGRETGSLRVQEAGGAL